MAVGNIALTGLTIPPASQVNKAAPPRPIAGAAARTVIYVTYGQDHFAGRTLNILASHSDPAIMLVQVLWGHACNSIASLKLNAQDLPTGSSATHYTGSQTTADSDLVAAFADQSITYTDTLAGLAYSVVKIPIKEFTGQLSLSATIQGRKVYDPRKDSTAGGSGSHRLNNPATWEWSDNPALCLADWLANADYGAGESVVWSSVPAAANANDATIGSPPQKRRLLGLTLTASSELRTMAESLRAYAACWLIPTSAGIKLLADQDDAPVASYVHASGQIEAIGDLVYRDNSSSPTVVEVIYTNTDNIPYRDDTATAELPDAGVTIPYRLSQIRLPGIQRYSQALREATERLNKLNLSSLTTTLQPFDIGIRHEIGDIIEVTHPVGLTAQKMRVTGPPEMRSHGRWVLPLTQHNSAAYSDLVSLVPGYGDPSYLIFAGPPSDVTGLGYDVANGVMKQFWDACLDIDYRETEVRDSDSGWEDAVTFPPLFRGRVNEWQEIVTAVGTYTRYYRHYDYSGKSSAHTASQSIVVTADGLLATNYRMVLVPPTGTLVTDSYGIVQDFSTAKTRAVVLDSIGDDVTSEFTVSKTDYGVVSTLVVDDITVTGWDPSQVSQDVARAHVIFPLQGNTLDVGRNSSPQYSSGGTVTMSSSGGPLAGTGYVRFGPATGTQVQAHVTYGPLYPLLFNPGENLSLSCWLRIVDSPNSITYEYGVCGTTSFNIALSSNGTSEYIIRANVFGIQLTASISGFVSGSATVSNSATYTARPIAVWRFVEATYVQTTRTIRLFVDGQLVGSQTTANGSLVAEHARYGSSVAKGALFYLGNNNSLANQFGGGTIDLADVVFSSGSAVRTASYSIPSAIRSAIAYAPAASIAVAAVKSGASVGAVYQIQAVPGGSPNIEIQQTVSSLIIDETYGNGNIGSGTRTYTRAQITFTVLVNGVDDSVRWGLLVRHKQDTAELAGTVSGMTVSITNVSSGRNSGGLSISFHRNGYPAQYREIEYSVVKAAQPQQSWSLSSPGIVLAGDWAGVVTSYAGASSTLTITEGGVTATGYSITRTSTSGITTSLSGNTVSVTAISAAVDSGVINLTATKAGWPTITAVVSVAKTRAPQPVVQVTGTAALSVSTTWDEASITNLPVGGSVVALEGSTDVTSSYTWSLTASAGITASNTGGSFALSGMSAGTTSGTITLTGTRSLWPTLTWTAAVSKLIAAQPQQSWSLSAPVITLAGDSAGNVASFAGAESTLTITEGGTTASGYTVTRTATTGITTSLSGNTVSVTAITSSVDSGVITLTAVKSGWPTITATVAVTKTRALLPASSPIATMSPIALYDEGAAGSSAAAHIRYRTDGTIQVKQGSVGSWVAAGNLYNPTTAGIGSSYWVRLPAPSPSGSSSGPFGVWTQISADVEYRVGGPAAGSGTTVALDATVLIASSSTGSPIVAQGSVALSAAYAAGA